jgi:tetratricopeptide (TPR) repeat protein
MIKIKWFLFILCLICAFKTGMKTHVYAIDDNSEKMESTEILKAAPLTEEEKLNKLGIEAYDQQKFEKAREYFEQAIEVNKSYTEALINLGLTYRQLEKTDQAIKIFQKINKQEPGNKQALQLLATVYLLKQMPEKSLEYYNELEVVDSNNPELYFGLGNVYTQMEDYKQANDYYKKAINLYSEEKPVLKSDAYLNLALNNFRTREYNLAISNLQEATHLNSESALIYYYLGLSYLYKPKPNYILARLNIKKAEELGYEIPEKLQDYLNNNISNPE